MECKDLIMGASKNIIKSNVLKNPNWLDSPPRPRGRVRVGGLHFAKSMVLEVLL